MVRTKVEICGAEDAPIVHIAPANGFPPHTYLPLLRGLAGIARFACRRGHYGGTSRRQVIAGDGGRRRTIYWRDSPPTICEMWWRWGIRLGDRLDVGAFGRTLSLQGAGHARSGVFSAGIRGEFIGGLGAGEIEQHPMVRSVRRRRRIFESREEAYTRFRAKPIFADWSDDSLRIYVEHGLREWAGGGFGLCWDVDWEAYYFSTVYERVWQELARLNGVVPTLVVRASESNTFPYESVAPLRSLLPAADYVELEGQGHLFPLAAPELTARVLREWLGTL